MERNWLEPPEWWKKWKPLRWLLALVALFSIYTMFADWRAKQPDTAAAPEAAAPSAGTAAEPEAELASAPTPPPAPPPPPPAAKPKPAPAPVAAAKPKTPLASLPGLRPSEPKPAPPPDPMARYTQVEDQRVSLMTQRSYDSLAAVQAALQQAGFTAELSTNERRARSSYPPHRVDTLSITEYKHLGSTGKLKLEFFNDRLYEAYFEPVEGGAYLRKLRKQTPLKREPQGRTEVVKGDLRIATNIDLAESDVGKALRVAPYILWQDLRLTQQLKDWGPVR